MTGGGIIALKTCEVIRSVSTSSIPRCSAMIAMPSSGSPDSSCVVSGGGAGDDSVGARAADAVGAASCRRHCRCQRVDLMLELKALTPASVGGVHPEDLE